MKRQVQSTWRYSINKEYERFQLEWFKIDGYHSKCRVFINKRKNRSSPGGNTDEVTKMEQFSVPNPRGKQSPTVEKFVESS